MSYTIIIPARFASSRLPGKPLKLLAGKPMLHWVVDAALRSAASRVCVATDNDAIKACAEACGVEAIMTASSHESGTDRLQEAATKLALKHDDIVVNLQGDEPLMPPELLDQVALNLERAEWASMATLCEAIESYDEYQDANAVKVTFDAHGRALYFSRAPIPFERDRPAGQAHWSAGFEAWRHVGLYAYRTGFLNDFVQWPVHSLEAVEKLEQLRALGQGHAIHIEEAAHTTPAGVDTEDDLNRVAALLERAAIKRESE